MMISIKYHAITSLFNSKLIKPVKLFLVILGFMTSLVLSAYSFIGYQNVSAAPPVTTEDCFDFDAGTNTILSYYGKELNNWANPECPKEVNIPPTIGGVPVEAIATLSFTMKDIKSVFMPDTVTTIEEDSFGRNHLSYVHLGSNVTTIGDGAFRNNSIINLSIPASVTNIGEEAFANNQINNLTISGDSLSSIGDNVFAGNPIATLTYNEHTYRDTDPLIDECFIYSAGGDEGGEGGEGGEPESGGGEEGDGLTIEGMKYADINMVKGHGNACISKKLIIPSILDSRPVARVAAEAFSDGYLTEVVIPSGSTELFIDGSAFMNNRIKTVTINSDFPVGWSSSSTFESNPISTFTYNGHTYRDTDPLIDECYSFYGPENRVTGLLKFSEFLMEEYSNACIGREAVIPDLLYDWSSSSWLPVEKIDAYAFRYEGLTKVVLPASVHTIGDGAFSYNNITEVEIQGAITTPPSWEPAFNFNPISTFTYNGHTYRDTDPLIDECFTFDGSGTISEYKYIDFDVIDNHNSACLSRDLAIPSAIASVPVTDVDGSFSNIGLESINIPNGIENINLEGFYFNKISEVHIPDSVETVGNGVMGRQYDPSVELRTKKDYEFAIIHPLLYVNSSRIGVLDIPMEESYQDRNNDGDNWYYSLGVYIVNPAYAQFSYEDQNGNSVEAPLGAPSFLTGYSPVLDEYIYSYRVLDNPDGNIDNYYKQGDSAEIPPAPAVLGYTVLGSPEGSAVLSATGPNEFTYVYGASTGGGSGDGGGSGGNHPDDSDTGDRPAGGLSKTGQSIVGLVVVSVILTSLALANNRIKTKRY